MTIRAWSRVCACRPAAGTRTARWLAALATVALLSAPASAAKLVGYAVLPADTFADGPPSGAFDGDGRRSQPRFPAQPVQGFSGIQDAGGGSFWVLSDNGFGAKKNSADYRLRVYRLRPYLRTAAGGPGTIEVESYIELSDPDRQIPFLIVNENTSDRVLTGADFDIESMVIAADGTLWFGDEFGPFLLHTDGSGRVLEAPISLPDFRPGKNPAKDLVQSPDNPFLTPAGPGQVSLANLSRSKGFEGMAANPDKSRFYVLLEGPLAGDRPDRLRIYEFDPNARRYTGRTWTYRLEDPSHAIGDMTVVNDHEFLIIERDNGQGPSAKFKKIFKVDLNRVDATGDVMKKEVVDLLRIDDPDGLAGMGPVFTFPFVTIEDVLVVDARTLIVMNDNNYPATGGRGSDVKDPNEFLVLKLDQPLDVAPGVGVNG